MSIPAISGCDLSLSPERYDGESVEVSGSIDVQFESMTLFCRDSEPPRARSELGIWLSFDLEAIRARSPRFYQEVSEGCRLASQWKGGLNGEMRFRGHFTLSKEWMTPAPGLGEKRRIGLGHMGMYGAEIVVEEVLAYRSTTKMPNKAPEPTPTSVTSPAAQEPRQP